MNSESGIICCQPRTASTEPSPLPSVVTTRVGHLIDGRSGRTSIAGTERMKPSWVDSGVRPISFAQPSIISASHVLPSRPGMVQRAQLSTPLVSICSSHDAARGPTETSPETMPPSTASERTRSGWRAARRSAIGQATFAAPIWKRSRPSWSASARKSSMMRSTDQR